MNQRETQKILANSKILQRERRRSIFVCRFFTDDEWIKRKILMMTLSSSSSFPLLRPRPRTFYVCLISLDVRWVNIQKLVFSRFFFVFVFFFSLLIEIECSIEIFCVWDDLWVNLDDEMWRGFKGFFLTCFVWEEFDFFGVFNF